MRTSDARLPLQRAAERLRVADGEAWEAFLARLDDFGDAVVEAVLKAPAGTGDIYIAQGRAKGVREIAEALRSAPQQIRAVDEAAAKRNQTR